MKELLTCAPISKVLYQEKEYTFCIDASLDGLSGFLMKNGNAIFYESRKLGENEKNYATHDLDLNVLVHTFWMWIHYLLGNKFELKIDHHV